MIGDTSGIETEYKKAVHAKREIPVSSCPSVIEDMMYSTRGTTSNTEEEEIAGFRTMLERLDAQAEKYESYKTARKKTESLFQKKCRLGIRGGEWCTVDTDNKFWCGNNHYRIDEKETQYQPVETEIGEYYAMDRILVSGGKFYDMNYDEVKVYCIGGIVSADIFERQLRV